MELPISLQLRPSPTLTAALLLAHGFALAGALSIDAHLAARTMLATLLLGSAWFSVRRGWQREGRLAALRLTDRGELEVVNARAERLPVRISAATTVFAHVVVLLYKGDRGMRSLVLPVDSLGKEGHRMLRVWLRWRADIG